jgi:hypothetical protein
LLSYNAQWYFGGSDATNTIVSNCNFWGRYLSPAFETFRSSGAQFLNCVSTNGAFSSNASGGWLISNPTITITPHSWTEMNGFNTYAINQPMININSNIHPPDASMTLGGTVRNVAFTCQGSVGYTDNSFIFGAFVGVDNPNVTFDHGFFRYPIQDGEPTQLVGAAGIVAQGSLATGPLNCVANDITVTGFSAAFFGNIHIDGTGATATNCHATYILINGVLI